MPAPSRAQAVNPAAIDVGVKRVIDVFAGWADVNSMPSLDRRELEAEVQAVLLSLWSAWHRLEGDRGG